MREYRAAKPATIARINAVLRRNPEVMLNRVRDYAAKRGKAFNSADWDYFLMLLECPCFYCDYEPEKPDGVRSAATSSRPRVCPSSIRTANVQEDAGAPLNKLDRVDNDAEEGYDRDNVVPCCTACNMIKWTHSYGRFVDICNRVVDYTRCEITVRARACLYVHAYN